MVEAIVSTDSNATFLSTVEGNMPLHFPEVRHACIAADARELEGPTLRNLLGAVPDIVMGGPPCDDYTGIGRRRGFEGEKGPLIFHFLRLVSETKPSVFVFENVPNLAQQFKTGFSHFLKETQKRGYATAWKLLRSCDFGAPTLRTRLFVVGWLDPILGDAFAFPEPTHGDPAEYPLLTYQRRLLTPFLSTRDVLEGLPDVGDQEASGVLNHMGRRHRPETIRQLREVPPGKSTGKSFRYRAPWNGLTQSLTAGLDNNTKSYIHPLYHREMSVREYARLHMFPDSWGFAGTQSNGLKQVANSVPIPLGEAVLFAVIRHLLARH